MQAHRRTSNCKVIIIGLIAQLLLLATRIVYLSHVIFVQASATATPKDLVSLSTNGSSNVFSLNSTPIQFQNEYQQRYPAQKQLIQEKHKVTTPPSFSDFTFDHSAGGITTTEYTYPEGKLTSKIQTCEGRLKLTSNRGFITDGSGSYPTNLQCTWIIDSGRNNATIRIRLQRFNSECNFDHLYIFDGDSIESPLVASLSGDMKDFSAVFRQFPKAENVISNGLKELISNNSRSPVDSNSIIRNHYTTLASSVVVNQESRLLELVTTSGKAFIYFHSDTALGMSGFHITYSIDSCPLDCSYRGKCDTSTLNCKCNSNFYGDGCQYSICPNNCTSQDNGLCDSIQGCICNKNFHGLDCSISREQQIWVIEMTNSTKDVLPRAFHQSVVVNDVMWVIGGRTQPMSNPNQGIFKERKSSMVSGFDLLRHQWLDEDIEGTSGVDHLSEVTGHSIAAKGGKVFIYGGMAMNNSILNSLTIFDVKTKLVSTIPNQKTLKNGQEQLIAPIAVVGHSANIIDSHMYIFLGYNPHYGYLGIVQKFGLADNSWSLVENRGSSIEGSIGHSTSYDPVSRLVFLYGGHHSDPSRSLYSFNPDAGAWTYLSVGPSARYHHTALILGRRLVLLGGNGYKTLDQSDQCFHSNRLSYDVTCAIPRSTILNGTRDENQHGCAQDCWQSIEDVDSDVLKRYGHSLVHHQNQLLVFGGFNGLLLNDLQVMTIRPCNEITSEPVCIKPKIGIHCRWNTFESRCEEEFIEAPVNNSSSSIEGSVQRSNCTITDLKNSQATCEGRQTCTDCLSTNLDCIWCGSMSQCQFERCRPFGNKPVSGTNLCHKDELGPKSSMSKEMIRNREMTKEIECKRFDNCYLCSLHSPCSWHYSSCIYSGNLFGDLDQSPNNNPSDDGPLNQIEPLPKPMSITNNSPNNTGLLPFHHFDTINKSFLDSFATNLLTPSPDNSCDSPCYLRKTCRSCTATKCIWCSTTQQCIDSSAYFAYYAMGECMHYVAMSPKCPASTCSDMQNCATCLANPRCGWLNDISNTGKGNCLNGDSRGPSNTKMFGVDSLLDSSNGTSLTTTSSTSLITPQNKLPNWHYTSCPSCQCNGHSYCLPETDICVTPCMDNTVGLKCQRCASGYYGNPINGGTCEACVCNGHAQSCNKDTGKCYCSTKGIIGYFCQTCDELSRYVGDPLSNGTCHYNLTTDYHFTFNMSKPEDHFYSDINFVNIPVRKDSDVEFTIQCSKLAMVDIASGTSYDNRKPLHTEIGCGSFRTKFSQDKFAFGEANFSFFVHVYKFQTPLTIQIGFTQHRTIYLPQFFFTFTSAFLFFFVLSGIALKLKNEFDLYLRRQRQFIEMEQMAKRPFSTIMLDVSKQPLIDGNRASQVLPEPTPISFEPCFGSNVGVMSFFVRLPGKPDLAIGSALISLNDESASTGNDQPRSAGTLSEFYSIFNG